MRAGWNEGEPDRAEEKLRKKRGEFWRYGERPRAPERRTGKSRVKEWRYRKGSWP